MKKWLVTILIIAVLATAGLTVNWWFEPLLKFVGANSDIIQGLTDLIQMVLWILALLTFVGSLWLNRKQAKTPSPPTTRADHTGSGDITQAEQANIAKSHGDGAAIGKIEGPVNIIYADSNALWQHISGKLPPEELHRATDAYLKYIVERYRYLELRGMGVSDRVALKLPLAEMYVSLKARVQMPKGETWARDLRLAGRKTTEAEAEAMGRRLSEPQPILDLLRQYPGLILLGDPGAGKTTSLKYLALLLAGVEAERLGLGPRLPVLLPLSAYANALAKDEDIPLEQFIARYYRNQGVNENLAQMLAEALQQGGALILLDGLDEVKDPSLRRKVVERAVNLFIQHQAAGNKFILSSRIVGYREVRPTIKGLTECTLADFEDDEISDFIDNWTALIERSAAGDTAAAAQNAARERRELRAAIQHNTGVRRLAANPLLLTILALMKRQGVELPDRRVELYDNYVKTLLKSWNLARSLNPDAPRSALDEKETTRVLAPLALWMHQTSPGEGLVKEGAMRRKLTQIYRNKSVPDPEQAADLLLNDVRQHTGLLLERGAGEYGFIHLTFQEYLAAVAIAQQGQEDVGPVVDILAAHAEEGVWREASLLTIGYMGLIQDRDEAAGKVVQALLNHSPRAAVLAAEAAADVQPGGVDLPSVIKTRAAMKHTMAAKQVTPPLRAAAANALARLGDDRPGVSAASILLTQELKGKFLYGEDDTPTEITQPFRAAVYPVTNAQFNAFVEAGGYRQEKYWQAAIARGYWSEAGFKGDWDDEPRDRPVDYGEPFTLPNHPVVGISWFEALAFCIWLTEEFHAGKLQVLILGDDGKPETLRLRSGQARNPSTSLRAGLKPETRFRLPTEKEWEFMARGEDGREYPWEGGWQDGLANTEESKIGATSAAGLFPGGQSWCGAKDCAGNVWEWCADLENDDRTGVRALRGGNWDLSRHDARCAHRLRNDDGNRSLNLGFRVACSPIGSES